MTTSTPSKGLDLAQLTDKIQELSVLPHVVFKVLEVSASAEAPAAEVERVITVDPGFSGKVLVLANSAAFGLPKKVTSIREAVSFLGFRNLRNIALTVGAYDLFVGKTDRESLRRRAWWRQSIDAALCARWLAKRTRKVSPEEAYTCGLLHLIGKTLMDRYAGLAYELVEEMVDLGIADYVAERDAYGYTHADVAAAAAAKWGLPETLHSALHYLDEPDANDPFGDQRAILAISSWLAYHTKGVQSDAPTWAAERLGFDSAALTLLTHECAEALADANMHL